MLSLQRILRPLLAVLLLATSMLTASVVQAACTAQGCVMAGPRLVSLNTQQGTLLNPLLGGLLGTSLNVSVLDWQAISGGEVDVAKMLDLLQVQYGLSSPDDVLNANNISLVDILKAAASASVGGNNAALSALSLNAAIPLSNIRLGDLLQITQTPTNTSINALDLVTGLVQLYNKRYVLTTPQPVSINLPSVPGVTGVSLIELYAQVVEPPVYVCGPTGSHFYTAAIRLKLNIHLPAVAPAVNGNLGILSLSVSAGTVQVVGDLSVYVDVARAQGTIGTLNALGNAMNLTATPGVADIYIGTIADATFFNRTRGVLSIADFGYANIGNVDLSLTVMIEVLGAQVPLVVPGLTSTIKMKTYARGTSPSASGLTFTGPPYPQTQTVYTGAAFISQLTTDLITHLDISISLNLGILPVTVLGLDVTVANALKPIVGGVLSPVLGNLLTYLVDPVFDLVGLRLGEAVITAYGVYNVCSVSGVAYNDANHSAKQEYAETGTGLTLYAKLVSASKPTTVFRSVAVNSSTGTFSFSNIIAAPYTLIIDTSNTASDVTATTPTAWIATEVPTLSRSFTMTSSDVIGQSFGLYNGSSLTGHVFSDNGISNGTANNAIRDGGEISLPGIAIKVTDSAGATTYDSTTSSDAGVYTLWIPASAGATTLKVTEANAVSYVSVGGTAGTTSGIYTLATDTLGFTNAIGTVYSGVNFADVPANQFDTDGKQSILPGNVAFYPHAFTAGTAGTLTLSGAATAVNGWSHLLYRDVNCNGAIDTATDTVISAPVAVAANDKVCVLARVFASETAALDEQYPVTVSASFAYANNSLTGAHSRIDLTVAGGAGDAGLKLTKVVDRAAARTGDVLTYTITYRNNSPGAITALKVNDFTPSYTVFTAASCGALPPGITGCTLTTQPTVGTAGAVEWSFTGELASGASGAVTLQVTLQ